MSKEIIPQEIIESRIYIIRCHKVMLDSDLVGLYGVTTKTLNQAVARNLESFPEDFMYKLKANELKNLRFQIGTSRWERLRGADPCDSVATIVGMLSA